MLTNYPFILAFFLLYLQVNSICYFPDGTTSEDSPCSNNGTAACCGTGWACLSNGICAWTPDDPDGQPDYLLFRGSCTDPTWQDPACPLFCLPGDSGASGVENAMGQCSDNVFYCLDDDEAAATSTITDAAAATSFICNDADLVITFSPTPTTLTIIGNAYTAQSALASTSSTSESTLPSTSSSSQSASPSATSGSPSASPSASSGNDITSAPSKKSSNALALGLGLGLGIPAFITIAIVSCLIYRYRSSKLRSNKFPHDSVAENHNRYAATEGRNSGYPFDRD